MSEWNDRIIYKINADRLLHRPLGMYIWRKRDVKVYIYIYYQLTYTQKHVSSLCKISATKIGKGEKRIQEWLESHRRTNQTQECSSPPHHQSWCSSRRHPLPPLPPSPIPPTSYSDIRSHFLLCLCQCPFSECFWPLFLCGMVRIYARMFIKVQWSHWRWF